MIAQKWPALHSGHFRFHIGYFRSNFGHEFRARISSTESEKLKAWKTYICLVGQDRSNLCQFKLSEEFSRSLLRISAVSWLVNFDCSKIFICKIKWIHSVELEFKAVRICLCHIHIEQLRCKHRIISFQKIWNWPIKFESWLGRFTAYIANVILIDEIEKFFTVAC